MQCKCQLTPELSRAVGVGLNELLGCSTRTDMHTDTEYLRGISENQNLPTLLRDTLRNAAAEIERLHTALVAITNVPAGTVLTAHQMRMIAKNAIAT